MNYLHCMHVGACIACRLCDKCFWAGNGFEAHVKSQHHRQEAEWYEPEAQLGRMKLEPASNIRQISVIFLFSLIYCHPFYYLIKMALVH